MKKICTLAFSAMLLFSCTKENLIESEIIQNENEVNMPISSPPPGLLLTNYYVIDASPTSPICPPNVTTPQTDDLEIRFGSSLAYDTFFQFSVQIKDEYGPNYTTIIETFVVEIKAGQNKAILNASCVLPDNVPCPGVTGNFTRTFKIKLQSIMEVGSPAQQILTPSTNDYYITTASRYCLGGGWGGGL